MVCNALANTTIKVLGVSYAGFVRNMSALRNTKTLVSLVLARLFKNYGIRVVFKSNIVWGKGNSADRCNSKFIHGDKGGPPGGGDFFFLFFGGGGEGFGRDRAWAEAPLRGAGHIKPGQGDWLRTLGAGREFSALFFFFFLG